MKRIGLIGGISWESTLEYYKIINEEIKNKLGKSNSANCILYSFNFQEIEELQHQENWDELNKRMVQEAINLKKAEAEFIVICANTMHLMASNIEKETNLKVLHIAKATAKAINEKKINKILLLGTKFTMEGDFYKNILNNNNIEVVIPNQEDRNIIHNIIYNELVRGIIKKESKQKYIKIINKIKNEGVKGVVLGCTEIPLLINQKDLDINVFDTTSIHAKAAAKFSLQ